MRDHVHFVWHCPADQDAASLMTKFKQHTGREMSALLSKFNRDYLDCFTTERADRNHKIWKSNSAMLRIEHRDILSQKIAYIHDNPVRGEYKTVSNREDYLFSSAKAYLIDETNFSFLTLLDR